MPFARAVAFFILVPLLAACSPGGVAPSVFNVKPPSGVITAQVVGQSSIVPLTSVSSPLQVNNGFSLLLSEANYTDVFSATILSYTGDTACYSVAMNNAGTTAIFTPTCLILNNVVSVQIKDVRNNTAVIFFENAATM